MIRTLVIALAAFALPAVAAPKPTVPAVDPLLVTKACEDALKVQIAAPATRALLATRDVVTLPACERRAPFVHILVVTPEVAAMAGVERGFSLVRKPASADGTSELAPLSELATGAGAIAAMNGFVWDGDQGTAAGDRGRPLGSVRNDGTVWSSSRLAEAVLAFGRAEPGKGQPARMFRRDTKGKLTPAGFDDFARTTVPSTTSIRRDDVCRQRPGEAGLTRARWSAIGLGDWGGHQRVVMLSSVSPTAEDPRLTDSAEICRVLAASGMVRDAIRLDGGPSASIWWNRRTWNPADGVSLERRISWAIVWGPLK